MTSVKKIYNYRFYTITLLCIFLEFSIASAQSASVDQDSLNNMYYITDTIRIASFYRQTFNHKINYNQTFFLNEADFGYATFDSTASFFDSEFDSVAWFYGITFKSGAYFDGCKFYSEARFDKTKFGSVLFDSRTGFYEAVFNSMAYFRESLFNNRVHFRRAQFQGDATFHKAQFKEGSFFSNSTFKKISFNSSLFKENTHFRDVSFSDDTDFSFAVFEGWADFENALFEKGNDFYRANFKSFTDFSQVNFKSGASYAYSTFDSTAYFFQTKFGPKANFAGSTFKGEVNMFGATLPDILILSKVKTADEIDLTYTLMDSSKQICLIDLYGTDISKLKFDYSRFKILQYKDYEKKHISHLYEQILKMQKEKGFIDGYEKADKEYQHFKLIYQKPFVAKSLGWLKSITQQAWWDYGYQQDRIFFWIFYSVALFTWINSISFREMNENVYEIDTIYNAWKEVEKKHPTKISLGIFSVRLPNVYKNITAPLFYTCLIFFGLRLNIDKIKFEHTKWIYSLGVIYLFIQYAFGILCLAYLANFILN